MFLEKYININHVSLGHYYHITSEPSCERRYSSQLTTSHSYQDLDIASKMICCVLYISLISMTLMQSSGRGGADRQHNGHKYGSSISNFEILILLMWRKFFIRKYNKMGEKFNICNRATTNFSLRVKRPERKADYSPKSNAEFKNEWSCTSMSPYAFMSCTLPKPLQDAFNLCDIKERALLCFNVDI